MNIYPMNTETKLAEKEVQELMKSWLTFLDCSDKTRASYTRSIKRFAIYLYENGIKAPTRQDIINYRDSLRKDHKPTTVNAYLMAVKQFYKWAVLEELLPKDVTVGVKSIKLDTGFKKDYLTPKQVQKLLGEIDRETVKGKRDYAVLSLMVTTGLRTVEVARADFSDLRPVGDFTALFIQGKGRAEKNEYVKVSEHVEEAIREYRQAANLKGGALFQSIANRNYGERMTTRSISRIAKDHMIDADLNSDRLTAHSLRHTTATLNLLNGGTPEETQQLLRHKNINTTLIYSHALERAKNNSEQRISAAIFG